MSIFGNLGSSSLGATERKTGTLFGSTTAPSGGLLSQPQQQNASQNTGGLFGSTNAAPQQSTGGLFGSTQQQNTGSSLFGASQQQQQQQQPLQQSINMNNSIFGGKLQPAPSLPAPQAQQLHQSQSSLPQLRQTANAPFASTLVSGQSKQPFPELQLLLTH
jgi:nuclear pore complex protein Nup54